MPSVAVVVHKKKVRGDGPSRVREVLRAAGVPEPLWYEVPKSKKARECAREAAESGADLLYVWGGDGTVQRCVDTLAGSHVAVAIIPAGTSNLLASALGVPDDLEEAVRIGLEGDRRRLDTGTVNGEHFAVVAGAGLDALLVRDAGSDLKHRLGRAAYLYTGLKNIGVDAVQVDVEVDGERFFRGSATSVLVGNTREAVGGVDLFDGSEPDDGLLELGVVTAEGLLEWARAAARAVVGSAERSPFVHTGQGRSAVLRFDRPVPYELDGGDREPARTLEIAVHPRSITVCVPTAADGGAG